MRRALVFAVLALSCGSEVQSSSSSGSSGAGGGHTTSSSTSSASGDPSSSSVNVSSSTSTGPASSSASTGAGGSGGGGSCAGLTMGPGDYDETMADNGAMRTYHVHVPKSYSSSKPTSLVFVFHGYTQTSSGIEDISQMDPVADAHGFVAVYPQGLSNSWNAGSCCGTAAQSMVDDLKFVGDMLDQLEKDYCIDPKRVFASGLSNGGMLSHRLACEMSDRIAAIGAVAGTLAIDTCAPPRPVAVLHVHGTADFVVPYNGGGLSGGKSVPDTIAAWTKIDGCTDATPTNVYMKGDATCNTYENCNAGVAVELCTIDQGGHQWPGGHSDFLGKLSTDLDASEEMAKFFEAHPMP
jgi:polyhydroxybutyrate depolymerase